MAKTVPLPPRRPADLEDDQTVTPSVTEENTYPYSDIPVDPDYAKRLEEGYKTPKKRMPIKKAKGGMVRGFGIAVKGHGRGKMC